MPERFALILGTGFEELIDATAAEAASTPYGAPSSPLYRKSIGGAALTVLARHGADHTLPPHAINYRANIAALDAAGVTAAIALNTVGLVTNVCSSGQLAVPDQLVDYTWGRDHTFHTGGDAGVRHIDFTEPFSARLRQRLLGAAASAGVDCYDGGVYAAIQGPRLETAAEIDRLDRDGCDYVGMTGMPEAALAAERGLAYAMLALVVNPAAGRGEAPIHDAVEQNSAAARALALIVIETLFGAGGDG